MSPSKSALPMPHVARRCGRWTSARREPAKQNRDGKPEERGGRSTRREWLSRQHAVFLEPGLQLLPRILGRLLAIARPIVGMEAMGGIRIDFEFGGLARRLQRGLHLLDLIDRNARVGG